MMGIFVRLLIEVESNDEEDLIVVFDFEDLLRVLDFSKWKKKIEEEKLN